MPRFSKKSRLLLRKEFECVHKAGVRAGTEKLFVAFLSGKVKRLGLIVGKKAGTAVTRNRIKRVLREHFRLRSGLYPSGDCIVVVKSDMRETGNRELRINLEKALIKLWAKLERKNDK
jgi:ribonuclease P protein component